MNKERGGSECFLGMNIEHKHRVCHKGVDNMNIKDRYRRNSVCLICTIYSEAGPRQPIYIVDFPWSDFMVSDCLQELHVLLGTTSFYVHSQP